MKMQKPPKTPEQIKGPVAKIRVTVTSLHLLYRRIFDKIGGNPVKT